MFDYSSYDATTNDDIAGAMFRATQIKPSSIQIDPDTRSAYIKASRYDYWYKVTLSSCDCGNFTITNSESCPCKHMFRLAMELGIELSFPVFDPVRASKYDASADLELLHKRWVDGEITFDAYKSCKSALAKSSKEAKKLNKGRKKK